jgi:hypothetical protein
MNTIILLLQALLMGDPDLSLPTPERYLKLYCQYHTHPHCGNMPPVKPEPEADSSDTGMVT